MVGEAILKVNYQNANLVSFLRGQNMVVKQPKIFHIALKKGQPFSCPFLFYNFFL